MTHTQPRPNPLRAAMLNDLAKLDGKPPYDASYNYLVGDNYFAKSLESKYGMTLDAIRKLVEQR